MKRVLYVAATLVCVLGLASLTSRPATAQTSSVDGRLDAPALRKLIEGLGYEVKDIGSEKTPKFEFPVTTKEFNIPVAAELSASGNYVWLTVFLNEDPAKVDFRELVKRNFSIQPCQFYMTSKDKLMMAVAVDNRAVTSAILKRNVEKLAQDVGATSSVWNVK